MSTVGDMLRLARQRLGFTQKSTASKLGITQPILSRFENGPSEPDGEFLGKAASVYNLPKRSLNYGNPYMVRQ
ncbi:helix-turn-helix domain-containing protein [Qipengyuania sp. NPDC077563]|uniref:helix-turn-helix domain-containing protein n=1 Tax=Qipengyuania sp. NPDC077563 TaxID=3364497 RepID=UPI00384ED340